MNPDRWSEIEKLYHDALEHEPDARKTFLDHCPDEELRREVQSLLANEQKGDQLFENSPGKPRLGQFATVEELRPALAAGTRLGPYEIVSPIGAGGMGEVYRARDARLDRTVAIKILASHLDTDAARKRFNREARALSSLNHPNICALYDVGHQDGIDYLVMEYLDGETLAQTLKKGRLPLDQALRFSIEIAEALDQAHRHGVIHRDLKPGNLMVTRDAHVKILDFGLAKQWRRAPDSTTTDLTDEGVVLGTAGYMSPEQVRGELADHRSDMFSFGVVLYEVLCGERAFSGASAVEVMNAILKDDPPELAASVPPALAVIVRRCLEKAPDRRFQSGADLGFALQSLSLSPARTERPKRREWLKRAAVLAACATAGAAYWLVVRTSRPAAPPETSLRRLTNDPDLTTGAAISTDGKLVAFVRKGDIWVQQVDGSGLIRITDDPADDYDPAFSPDGTQIAFRSERGGGGIYITPVLGGEARQLVPQGRQPRFSPDGRRLMYWIGPPDDTSDLRWRQAGLFVQATSGGPATQVGAGCGLAGTGVWSPDGSRILFRGECGSDVPSAWVSALDGKGLKSNHDVHGVPDQWIPDPPRLLIRQRAGDATYIVAVPVSADGIKVTGPSQRLTSFTENVTHVSAAWDGRMAFSVSAGVSHIWGLPIDGGGRATGEPKQLTHGSAGEWRPSLSRDGGKVVFISPRANGDRFFYKDLVTGQEKELSTDGHGFDPVFSPDGSGVMCVQRPFLGSAPPFIYFVPLSGGLPKKIWDKAFVDNLDDWAPDGKTLLFYPRDDPSKPLKGTIRQLDLDSRSTTMFLDDPEFALWEAHFSHDGRWVAFNATTKRRDSSHIYVAPFRKALLPRGEWLAITDGNWDDKPRFSYDDKLLFFVSGLDDPRRIWAQRLKSDMRPDGKPVAVYPLGQSQRSPFISFDEISVGPDLIVFTQAEAVGNIWLLEPVKRDAH
jgi:Tol biopolymer transport system component/predicted Ser/Thr protein kinase